MIIIGLSDIHGDTAYIGRIGDVLKRADFVVLAGDITHFAHANQAARVVEAVRRHNASVLAVPGNCDHPDVDQWLNSEDINLHPKSLVTEDIGFAGLGGSIYTPFNTPFEYSETQAGKYLSEVAADIAEDKPFILVSHQPPAETSCDRLRDGRHVGSRKLRRFIETRQPLVCVTGHIHESVAADRIGETWVVNPGPLWRGHYAYAHITGRQASVEIRKIL
ncbi:MAG: metallophosphoesterase family protein [Desulfobacteraceae bacterium]|nr:metallophosphoesterase family protein [Desulfobacteraceae bacterium]